MEQTIVIKSMEGAALSARLDAIENAITKLAYSLTPQRKEDKGYLTRKEVATLLQITLPTVHEWTRKGVLKAYKIGKRVYYKADEVSAAMVQKGGGK